MSGVELGLAYVFVKKVHMYLKMATARVFWTSEETNLLLAVIEEKNILKLIDGKRHRKKEVVKIIEEDFKSRGFVDKNCQQLENKWKNLKKEYTGAKKINSRSGEGRATCEYYEELDRLLGARPSSSMIPNAIDSFENPDSIVGNSQDIFDTDNEPEALTSRARGQKRPNHGANMVSEVKMMCQSLQKDFLEEQKNLINYEFKLYAEEEKKLMQHFCQETKKIFDESNKSFLSELKELLSEEKQTENKENISTQVENELGEFIFLTK